MENPTQSFCTLEPKNIRLRARYGKRSQSLTSKIFLGQAFGPRTELDPASPKYMIAYQDTEDGGDNKIVSVMFAGPGKGGAIVKGPTYFVVGLYDEKKEQNKASCSADLFKVCEQVNAA